MGEGCRLGSGILSLTLSRARTAIEVQSRCDREPTEKAEGYGIEETSGTVETKQMQGTANLKRREIEAGRLVWLGVLERSASTARVDHL